MNETLLRKAEEALRQIDAMAASGWAPAVSIARQLKWCVALASGRPRDPLPGPFSMGLVATREFDMYGDQPELALLINEVQREAERKLAESEEWGVPLVAATVTLLPELQSTRRIADRTYRPHIVIGPTSQRQPVLAVGNVLTESYLGVCFWSGPEELLPGLPAEVSLALMYFAEAPEQYSVVVPGATFTVREGPSSVGYGRVHAGA